MTVQVRWPRGAAHTSVTSVQALKRIYRQRWAPAVVNDDPGLVYIGMPGKAADAAGLIARGFGKPWDCLRSPEGWRYAYAQYLKRRLADDPAFREAVRGLHGKTLVCWCKGSKRGADPDCHGDLLAEFAERLHHEEQP